MSFEKKLRTFILENYLFTEDESELDNADSFLDSGIIDSTGILEVITFIQDECDFVIDDDDMIPENLDSVNNILAFINKKSV
ncbi:Acyl carrier protein [hydrothermal vent metagenome]|uniref:Acyl carrier protein n=1 Tax=hydrothermal vent metagenome TaxID=652676 RepID=A0A3B0Y2N1_9ZZZZ